MKNDNPDYFKADTPDELFDEFKKASDQIYSFLKLKEKKIEFTRYETKRRGLDYIAICHSKSKGFHFQITTFTKDENVTHGEMTAYFEIYNSDGTAPFLTSDNLKHARNSPNFLQRWVSSAISQYNNEVLSDELKRLFYDSDIRVYGIPEHLTPTFHELTIFLKGIVNYTDKLIICKFKHIRELDNYRQFSYAFLAAKGSPPLWVFFLKAGSPDSGGAKMALDEIESLIDNVKSQIRVELNEFDVDYDKLVSYLLSNSRFFEKQYIPHLYEKLIFEEYRYNTGSGVFGKEFSKSYEKMEQYFKSGDIRATLQEIRPLVQHVLKITCVKKNIDVSTIQKQNISSLTAKLIDNKILDNSLQKWAIAFSHEPNEALHSIYPTEEDLFDPLVRSRIILSIQVGLNIISTLHEVLSIDDKIDEHNDDENDAEII